MNLSGFLVLVLTASANAFSLKLSPPLGTSERNTRLAATASGTSATKQRAVVVGGGPAGALLAVYLARRRFDVELFETMEQEDIAGPTVRSWNVVLMSRGLEAIRTGGIDLQEEAGELALPLTGILRHHAKKMLKTFLNKSISICRGDLAITLLRTASKMENVNVHYGCTFSKMDMERRVATFERGNGEMTERKYDMLVGADGVNSRVRRSLEDTVPDFNVRQVEDPLAFKTILVPIMGMQDAEESWKACFHTINIKDGYLHAPPRTDGALSAVVILPGEGEKSFGAQMKTSKDVRKFFSVQYPATFGKDGPSEEVAKDFLERRPQRLQSLYCSKLAHGNTVLIGDAAHAMWATLGQGVNAALEDCRVLANVLDSQAKEASVDVPSILGIYNELRLKDAHAVCEMSEMGFGPARPMRPAFTAQLMLTTMLNKTLGKLAPKVFKETTFTQMDNANMSYGEVQRGAKRQAAVANAVFFGGVALAFVGVVRKALVKF